ncbi:peroxide stress regulator [Helicobacter cinaedi PAGU611]|uniref:Peroxide stress regulator n=1 Tax=Helicobacter cinaedi CCUG 18818 = ATCC BAA-847 TaxID=537971 RepID=A0AAI8QFZ8_9HELI|nr:Fur family transcriptional regulator [Helicobacter cinaedi]AWK61044.1 transcriptional repressor [Helicobacter cinaedi]EFR47461.1 transcriptional regulator, Fur family [Helicobacter cinaedi CCUG 18818 = ATCC BAA-847]QOQ90392.1 transcriptional repressor [Helicobacter cinaedi]QOQ96562.1 transcriptional repressor [Helicobacter cinaedi]BAM11507.1 peroxide stress regulator [Helicobacter cinaedi PAGU611]
MINFEQSLRENQLKITPQRLAMLDRIQKNGHMSVEELYEQIRSIFPFISLATIYKNIHALCEANILREIKAPKDKQKYELSSDRHLHVYCEICGKLEDIRLDTQALEKDCSQNSGYSICDISAVLIGKCPECRIWPKNKS